MPSARASIIVLVPLSQQPGIEPTLTLSHRFRTRDPQNAVVPGSETLVAQGPVPSPSVEGTLPYLAAMDNGGYSVECATVDQGGNAIGPVGTKPIPAWYVSGNVPQAAATWQITFKDAGGNIVP